MKKGFEVSFNIVECLFKNLVPDITNSSHKHQSFPYQPIKPSVMKNLPCQKKRNSCKVQILVKV